MNTRPVPWKPNTVFLIMPFSHPNMKEVHDCLRSECSLLGLTLTRADEYAGSGSIIHAIRRGILSAEFIIADLSYEKPNVYYELGYAHGTNNGPLDILLIAHQDTPIHFDVSHFRVNFYDFDKLRLLLHAGLPRMMKERRERRDAEEESDAMQHEWDERQRVNESAAGHSFPEDQW